VTTPPLQDFLETGLLILFVDLPGCYHRVHFGTFGKNQHLSSEVCPLIFVPPDGGTFIFLVSLSPSYLIDEGDGASRWTISPFSWFFFTETLPLSGFGSLL